MEKARFYYLSKLLLLLLFQLWKAIFIDFKSKTKAVFPDAGTGSGNSLRNAKGSKVCFIPREEKSLMKHNQPTAEGNGTKLSIGFQPHFDVKIIIAQNTLMYLSCLNNMHFLNWTGFLQMFSCFIYISHHYYAY